MTNSKHPLLIRRLVQLILAMFILVGPFGRLTGSADSLAGQFVVTGPDIFVYISRNGQLRPFGFVPYTLPGDQLVVQTPFADPVRAGHTRFHMVLANLRGSDAGQNIQQIDLNDPRQVATKPWIQQSIAITSGHNATALIFPENGQTQKHGVQTIFDIINKDPDLIARAMVPIVDTSEKGISFNTFLEELAKTVAAPPQTTEATAKQIAANLGINATDQFDTCWSKSSAMRPICFSNIVLNSENQGSLQITNEKLLQSTADVIGSRLANMSNVSPYLGAVLSLYQVMVAINVIKLPSDPQYQGVVSSLQTIDQQTRLQLTDPFTPNLTPAPLIIIAAPLPLASEPIFPHLGLAANTFCLRSSPVSAPINIDASASPYLRNWQVTLATNNRSLDNGTSTWISTMGDSLNGVALDATKLRQQFIHSNVGVFYGLLRSDYGFSKLTSDKFVLVVPGAKTYPKLNYFAGTTQQLAVTTGYTPCIVSARLKSPTGQETQLSIASRNQSGFRVALSFPQNIIGLWHVFLDLGDGKNTNDIPIQVNPTPTPTPTLPPSPVPTMSASPLPSPSALAVPTLTPTPGSSSSPTPATAAP